MRIFQKNSAAGLVSNKSGVTAVEFALLALPMFTLIMGSIELGIHVYHKARAQGVLREAGRIAMTGNNTINGKIIDDYVRQNISIIDNAKIDIEKSFYDAYSQVRQPERKLDNSNTAPYCFIDSNGNQEWDVDPSRAGLGGADDIINYKVTVTYDALFPLITNTVTGNDKVTIIAQSTMQNEPFAGSVDQQEQVCCVSAAPGNPVVCEA